MSLLPLVVHANPATLGKSHPVRLRKNTWRAISNNIVDTILVVTDGVAEYPLNSKFTVEEPTPHWLVIKTPGSERNITVMVEAIHSGE